MNRLRAQKFDREAKYLSVILASAGLLLGVAAALCWH